MLFLDDDMAMSAKCITITYLATVKDQEQQMRAVHTLQQCLRSQLSLHGSPNQPEVLVWLK